MQRTIDYCTEPLAAFRHEIEFLKLEQGRMARGHADQVTDKLAYYEKELNALRDHLDQIEL